MANLGWTKWKWTVGRDGEEVPNHENGRYIHGKRYKGPHLQSTFCISHLTFHNTAKMFLIFTGRCDLCRSLLLLLVCGHYGELVRIHFPNLPWNRQKHFRLLQLFIMYCWPLRNVSMRKVTKSLREFTRCSFLGKNILTLNVLLAWTRRRWIFQHHSERQLVFCL